MHVQPVASPCDAGEIFVQQTAVCGLVLHPALPPYIPSAANAPACSQEPQPGPVQPCQQMRPPNVQTFQALAGISAQEAPASRLVGIGTRCRRLKNCGPPTHQRMNTLTHTPITPSRAPLQGCDLGYAGRCVCLKMRHLVAGWQHPRCLL